MIEVGVMSTAKIRRWYKGMRKWEVEIRDRGTNISRVSFLRVTRTRIDGFMGSMGWEGRKECRTKKIFGQHISGVRDWLALLRKATGRAQDRESCWQRRDCRFSERIYTGFEEEMDALFRQGSRKRARRSMVIGLTVPPT